MGTPIETVSDVRDIYTGKGEGHNDVMNSRGMTTDEYMAMDFSKNKMLKKNGKPYETLYSGSPYHNSAFGIVVELLLYSKTLIFLSRNSFDDHSVTVVPY